MRFIFLFENNFERKNTDLDYINKIYRYIKNDMSVEEFMCKFRVSFNELKGILGIILTLIPQVILDISPIFIIALLDLGMLLLLKRR